VREFNDWSGTGGISFLTTEASELLSIPRSLESSHIMIMGDTGAGKSVLQRRVLTQVSERGETAIVYDPALEYTPQFFNAARGDLVLNPLDARCPYWSPADEVIHEAEALTLATSLFPDKPHENTFFVEGPRKIFAHLLTLKPNKPPSRSRAGFDLLLSQDVLVRSANNIICSLIRFSMSPRAQ
jgi:type IV secretory pathway TraG/TraD family ATPase VirD4